MRHACFLILLFSHLSLAEVTLVKVDKSLNTMYIINGDKIVEKFHVVFGKNPVGHKQQEGDQRTPEGRYFLDYKKEDSSFYRAMHISYPNKKDKENAKKNGVSPGGLIMIHGQKNGFGWLSYITQKFNWTDGCIALSNKEMDTFMELVKVGTPIEIDP
ncbi:murein L,D-transpeptidase family protein [Teredinibacter sp. KSP-S5-2]|uniref:L,D-transpeptidase family protein n=1 Tax=Teredinibacter sp. KSP-S5-2 TaxID=3034506 RepID=UPI00293477DD|nr:L,D-transpeptidase family protein [Teredinibacter sp. KSP-S5-2]